MRGAHPGIGRAERTAGKVVVRREDRGVAAQTVAGKNNMRSTIGSATYRGASTRLVTTVGGTAVSVQTNRPPASLAAGGETYLVWDAAHCSLVPAESPAS